MPGSERSDVMSMHASIHEFGATYSHFLHAAAGLTRDRREVVEGFPRMVFKVLACHRDEHVRNFAFPMQPVFGRLKHRLPRRPPKRLHPWPPPLPQGSGVTRGAVAQAPGRESDWEWPPAERHPPVGRVRKTDGGVTRGSTPS